MPSKWRKKPVVIEAVQWTGTNLREVIDFTGLNESANKWTWQEFVEVVERDGLKIFTLEGPLKAAVGSWIIKGVKGEFYPCEPSIFEATYERVDPLEPLVFDCFIHDADTPPDAQGEKE